MQKSMFSKLKKKKINFYNRFWKNFCFVIVISINIKLVKKNLMLHLNWIIRLHLKREGLLIINCNTLWGTGKRWLLKKNVTLVLKYKKRIFAYKGFLGSYIILRRHVNISQNNNKKIFCNEFRKVLYFSYVLLTCENKFNISF